MTEEEGDLYIALAMLHGLSTTDDIDAGASTTRGSHDPLHKDVHGATVFWWVYRDACCKPNFDTAAEAARAYCQHYGIEP